MNYLYNNKAERYQFYRIPKILFTNARFSSLTAGAKILYGLMLDRASLSAQNGWLDEQRRVYIFFSVEGICSNLGCARKKALKLLADLDAVGLTKRKIRRQGRPTMIYLTRSDWAGTYPTENIVWAATEEMIAALQDVQYNAADHEAVEMPTMGAENGLVLASMIGKDYDDPDWELLLDQLSFEEMVKTITLGYHNTAAIPSIGKAATKDENGPQGLTASLTKGASAMCYTSADVLAATFNLDLVEDVGRCMGEDCLNAGYSGLYGPGANIHRTAYSGRNFEYYSEDPFISGTICAAHVAGIQSKGVYCYLKHFALNDSETYRRGVSTWTNEQAAREIYLEAFAKPVTDGGCWCVMNAFARWGCTWAGAHHGLQTDFLRGELGMRGMAITDYSSASGYQDIADGLLGGSDIWDSSSEDIHTVNLRSYENDPVIVSAMRQSMHRILYTVANSNAMNGLSPNDTMKVVTPWWKTAITVLQVVLVITTLVCVVMLVKAFQKKKTQMNKVDAKK